MATASSFLRWQKSYHGPRGRPAHNSPAGNIRSTRTETSHIPGVILHDWLCADKSPILRAHITDYSYNFPNSFPQRYRPRRKCRTRIAFPWFGADNRPEGKKVLAQMPGALALIEPSRLKKIAGGGQTITCALTGAINCPRNRHIEISPIRPDDLAGRDRLDVKNIESQTIETHIGTSALNRMSAFAGQSMSADYLLKG
ncbi:hypothetical protein [Rhizobium herbae]